MIPVVMLGINTGAISSLLDFFCLAMTCPSFGAYSSPLPDDGRVESHRAIFL